MGESGFYSTTSRSAYLGQYFSQMSEAGRIERALGKLAELRQKLGSPRTRYRQQDKVAEAVADILRSCRAADWIVTEIEPNTVETLRQAMQRKDIEALPLYPEGRACRWPTARGVIDLFESVQRHTLTHGKKPAAGKFREIGSRLCGK